jgi:hypothetical protein
VRLESAEIGANWTGIAGFGSAGHGFGLSRRPTTATLTTRVVLRKFADVLTAQSYDANSSGFVQLRTARLSRAQLAKLSPSGGKAPRVAVWYIVSFSGSAYRS